MGRQSVFYNSEGNLHKVWGGKRQGRDWFLSKHTMNSHGMFGGAFYMIIRNAPASFVYFNW